MISNKSDILTSLGRYSLMLTFFHLMLLSFKFRRNISRALLMEDSRVVSVRSTRHTEEGWLRRWLSTRCSNYLLEDFVMNGPRGRPGSINCRSGHDCQLVRTEKERVGCKWRSSGERETVLNTSSRTVVNKLAGGNSSGLKWHALLSLCDVG